MSKQLVLKFATDDLIYEEGNFELSNQKYEKSYQININNIYQQYQNQYHVSCKYHQI